MSVTVISQRLSRGIKNIQYGTLLRLRHSATFEKQECKITAELIYEMNLIHHDRTMIFKYLRSMSKDSNVPILFHNGSPNYDQDTANLFNDYFNLLSQRVCDLPNHNNLPVPFSQLSQISLHITEVWEVLSCIAPSKAPGCDGISPKFGK